MDVVDTCIVLGRLTNFKTHAVVADFEFIYAIISVGMVGKQCKRGINSKASRITSLLINTNILK